MMDLRIEQPKDEVRTSWDNYTARREYVKAYSWAIPTSEAIKAMALVPLVEIGAGTGYWASLVQQAGGEIWPFDRYLGARNSYKHTTQWTKVMQGGPGMLKGLSKELNLFLCWPPYAEPMARQCLNYFQGQYVFYVGEGDGGCTGDDQFHQRLSDRYDLVEEMVLPTWAGIHDSLYVYKKQQR